MNNLGIYIHFPFCTQKCLYCNFYSKASSKEIIDNYTQKICNSINIYPFNHKKVDTIYFGGGTPILAGVKNIEKILCAINKKFTLVSPEITIEANPAYTLNSSLKDYSSMGINRISFGVQSLDNEQLKILGRSHNAQEAKDTISCAVKSGFDSVSTDIMLGIPKQTTKDIHDFVKTFSDIGVSHISAYMLKIEKGTPFDKNNIKKICPTEDVVCDMYEYAINTLHDYGFNQYEISNFAKNNKVSRHNIRYWQLWEYIGLGPSAHSYIGGKRFSFNPSTEEFCSYDNVYNHTVFSGYGGDFEEYVMLRLRLNSGLNLDKTKVLYPLEDYTVIEKRINNICNHGLATLKNGTISLTTKGFLVSNSVISSILWG